MAQRVSNDRTSWPAPEAGEDEATPLFGRAAGESEVEGHPQLGDLIELFDGSAGPPSEWPGPFTARPAVAQASEDESESWEAPVSLSDPENRQMLASSLQDNEVSRAAGNYDRICGGAAIVNALILSSDAKTCAANAKALEQAAAALGAQKLLPASVKQSDVDAALRAFSQGTVRPTDVQVLQQLAYASLRAIQADGSDTGATPAAMAILVNQLSVNGARLGDSKFTEVITAEGAAHWTVTTQRFTADSLPRPPVKGPQRSWEAEVDAPAGRGEPVKGRLRGGGEVRAAPKGQAYRFELPAQQTLPGGKPNLEDAGRAIRQGLALGPQKMK